MSFGLCSSAWCCVMNSADTQQQLSRLALLWRRFGFELNRIGIQTRTEVRRDVPAEKTVRAGLGTSHKRTLAQNTQFRNLTEGNLRRLASASVALSATA